MLRTRKEFYDAMEPYRDAEGWWLSNPYPEDQPIGPYDLKRDLEDDRRGLARTYAQIAKESS